MASIKITKDTTKGGYHCYVSLGKSPITGKRIVKHIRAKTKKEVEYTAIQLKMKYLEGAKIETLVVAFKDIYFGFMETRERNVKHGQLRHKTQN
ncbi:MAG: hypothetical protein ACRC0V_05640, partial [Fusobacteriaceae bacterium]